MKAQFCTPPSDSDDSDNLENNMKKFKEDPEKMQVVIEFINEILQNAQVEAERKKALQQGNASKESQDGQVILNIKNGKIIKRARGLVIRMFDVICNCANAATSGTRFAGKGQQQQQQQQPQQEQQKQNN